MPQYLHKNPASFKHKKHKFSALFPVTAVKRSSGIISSSEAMLVFVYYFFSFFSKIFLWKQHGMKIQLPLLSAVCGSLAFSVWTPSCHFWTLRLHRKAVDFGTKPLSKSEQVSLGNIAAAVGAARQRSGHYGWRKLASTNCWACAWAKRIGVPYTMCDACTQCRRRRRHRTAAVT